MIVTVKISVASGSEAARTIESIGGVVDHHYSTVNYGFCTEYTVQAEVVHVLKFSTLDLSALAHYRTTKGVEFIAGQHGPRDLDTFRIVKAAQS